MSQEKVRDLFIREGLGDVLIRTYEICDTTQHAAKLLGCETKVIAKNMCCLVDGRAIVIVISGDAKIDNSKYHAYFRCKAKMIPYDQVEKMIGHVPGGICPFALNEDVDVYLDESLKRFDELYTGGGDEYSLVKVTRQQLERYSYYKEWVDVCKNWQD